MREAIGDLWAYPADARCVTTNGIVKADGTLTMGKGVALEAARRFPKLPVAWGAVVLRDGNVPHWYLTGRLLSFPAKHHWREPSNLLLIEYSAEVLVRLVGRLGLKTVAMPRPGCGNGGLSWREVAPVLAEYLDDRFVVVHRDEKS